MDRQGLLQAELSHSGTTDRTAVGNVSGLSVINRASDSFTVNTGYSKVDGTMPSLKDRFVPQVSLQSSSCRPGRRASAFLLSGS